MDAQNTLRPIIIKKKKVIAGGGHHGGAWKVAMVCPSFKLPGAWFRALIKPAFAGSPETSF